MLNKNILRARWCSCCPINTRKSNRSPWHTGRKNL